MACRLVQEVCTDMPELESAQELSRSDQPMLKGVAGGGTARGDPNFAVDRGQVPVDGATSDDQLVSYLRIDQPLRH